MSTTIKPKAMAGRGIPLWAQIWIWAFLVGLLTLIGVHLMRAQQGNGQPGYHDPASFYYF